MHQESFPPHPGIISVGVGREKTATRLDEVREAGFGDSAERLEHAWQVETKVLALTIDEREEILRGLEDCPDALAELRGVLVREQEWRLRERL